MPSLKPVRCYLSGEAAEGGGREEGVDFGMWICIFACVGIGIGVGVGGIGGG